MSDDKHQILQGIRKGLGELGSETLKKTAEHSEKIFESVITGKELLGLDNTMNQGEIDFQKREDDRKSQEEIKKLKGEIGKSGNKPEEKQTERKHDLEGEMETLRDQKEKEEEEKEKYYAQMKEQQKIQQQQQQAEYDSLNMESTNPVKQKKSRGSALARKKKSQPDQSQMSQTSEFKGKID